MRRLVYYTEKMPESALPLRREIVNNLQVEERTYFREAVMKTHVLGPLRSGDLHWLVTVGPLVVMVLQSFPLQKRWDGILR